MTTKSKPKDSSKQIVKSREENVPGQLTLSDLAKAKELLREEEIPPEKKRLILQERKGYNPDEEEEFEDEEILTPYGPSPSSNPAEPTPPLEYPPDNHPDMMPPDPPPIRNESGEGYPPPDKVVAQLLGHPQLFESPVLMQQLVINLSVMNYISTERMANALHRISKQLEIILPRVTDMWNTALMLLDNRINEIGSMVNVHQSKMQTMSGYESGEFLLGPEQGGGSLPNILQELYQTTESGMGKEESGEGEGV